MMTMLFRRWLVAVSAAAAAVAAPAAAQVRTIDPNTASAQAAALQQPGAQPQGIGQPPSYEATPAASAAPAAQPMLDSGNIGTTSTIAPAAAGMTIDAETGIATPDPSAATYQESDVFAAAEGAFGKGAEGLAKLLEKALKEQGRPNAYIIGREAGGAIALGVRYGSGTMYHKVEGELPVYWTGPSVGFDIGGNGGKVFVLVYNLFDSEELFRRFPAAEGNLYAVGGFTASYLRRGDVVLIPIRLGVGWRAGINVGYMRFSKESRWLPF